MQDQFTVGLIIRDYTGRAVDILEFLQTVVGGAVGLNQAIHAEVLIMGVFTMVAAIVIHGFAVGGIALVDGVVTPFPDEATADTVCFIDDMEVILQVSGTVTHGMAVFAHDEGLVRVGTQIFLDIG